MTISLIFYIYMQTLSIKVTSKSKNFYYIYYKWTSWMRTHCTYAGKILGAKIQKKSDLHKFICVF